MARFFFWSGWVVAWLITALLFLWHLPFYPFKVPGVDPNEAAAVFLVVMFVRWVLIAVLIVWLAVLWTARRGSAVWVRVLAAFVCLAAHAAAGGANAVVWNSWVSQVHQLSAGAAWFLVGLYYGIPVVMLLILAAARLKLPRVVAAHAPSDRR